MAERKKRPHESSPVIGDNVCQLLKPGDNAVPLQIGMTVASWPKIDLRDSELVEKRLRDYFNLYVDLNRKPTIAGMAMALKLRRHALWSIAFDQPYSGLKDEIDLPPETTSIIKNYYFIMETMWESYMQEGRIHPTAGIFLGKNNFGYRDVIDYQVNRNLDSEEIDAESIRRKYMIGNQQIVNAEATPVDDE